MTMLLGVDIGTSAIKAALFDAELGQVTRTALRPTPVTHPASGWSEHDPAALWDATAACIGEAAQGAHVVGLAISSMAETGMLVDASGAPLAPMIAWYDRRSEPQAARVEQKIGLEALYRITGQRVSPSFGVTKLLWLRDNHPELFRLGAFWLPAPSFIHWRLTGTRLIDFTIAARTLLFDQRSLDWSAELLESFDLPRSLFPPAASADTLVGTLTAQAARETGLAPDTLCVLGGHDHLCAAFAAGAHTAGDLTDSTGSANALLLLTPHFLPDPALAQRGFASYAYLLKGLFALKGGLKAAGSAVDWLARQLSPGADGPDFAALEAEAWQGVGNRAGPLWLPHLIGSGTPQGDRFSQAALVGMQFEHTRGDLFRGLLEAVAMWTRQNVDEMQAVTGRDIDSLTLTGGVTRLRLLSQLKADVLNRPVRIPQISETAAVGAALLAGIGAGVFASPVEAFAALRYECEYIQPDLDRAAWYDALYHEAYLPLYSVLHPVNRALKALNDARGEQKI